MIGETIIATVRREEAARRLGTVLPWRPTDEAIEAAIAKLDAVQKRARARTLTEGNLRWLVEVYEHALALCAENGWDARSIECSLHGGYVPNSYGSRAEATYVHVRATRPIHVPGAEVAIQTGPGGIDVCRADVGSRPHGNGPTVRVGIRVPAGEARRPESWGVAPRKDKDMLWWRW